MKKAGGQHTVAACLHLPPQSWKQEATHCIDSISQGVWKHSAQFSRLKAAKG